MSVVPGWSRSEQLGSSVAGASGGMERLGLRQVVPSAPRRSGRSGGRGPLLVLAAIVVVLGGLLALGILWYGHEESPGARGAALVVEVRSGDTPRGVAGALVRQGVLGSSLAWRIYLMLHGTPVLRPGRYVVYEHESMGALLASLRAGPDVYALEVDPGQTMAEIAAHFGQIPGRSADQLSAAAAQVRSPLAPAGFTSLEGLVAPGIYVVKPGETATQVVQAMVDKFVASPLASGLASAGAAHGLSAYQEVIVASLVEKEGYIPANMGKVAQVVYNRLARGMPLQFDSTILYTLGQDGGTVTPQDLQIPSAYNTYLNKKLPPSPICVPSTAALQAAESPTPGSWLYFEVKAHSGGLEDFENTYAEHQQFVNSNGGP